jgi:hypothetical protein
MTNTCACAILRGAAAHESPGALASPIQESRHDGF